jgi:O-antigen/teichoic acid export membrane protein
MPPALRNDTGQFISTEHLADDLRGRSVRGGAATLFAQGCRFAIGLGSTAVLARLLTPGDYGLMGMVIAFTNLLLLVKDLGLTQATIQRQDLTDGQVSVMFWINAAIGAVLMLITLLGAPLLARFYEEPRLSAIAATLAVTFLLGGLGVQHEALLRRQMRFKAIAVVQVSSAITGAIGGVVAGLLGAGYWSLVVMQLVSVSTELVALWSLCRWRPQARFRGEGIRPLLAFGGNVMGANVLVYLTRNLDNVLIGRAWGATPLGLYQRAYDLLLLPLRQFNTPMTQVAIPTLSRLQSQPELFVGYYRKGIGLVTFLSMPLVAFMFSAATPLVRLVLGPGWEEVVPLFRMLAPAAFVGTFNVALAWLFLALGRADRQLRWTMFSAIITTVGFLVGVKWGAMGVAASFSITTCCLRPFGLRYCFAGTPVTMLDFFRAVWRPAVAALTAGAGLFVVDYFVADKLTFVGQAAVDLVVYALLYFGVWTVLPGGVAHLRDIMLMARELRPAARN